VSDNLPSADLEDAAPVTILSRLKALPRAAVGAVAGSELASLLVSRFLLAIPLLLGVSLLTFGALRLAAGDQLIARLGDRANSPEIVAQLREELGLNDPFFVQYFRYLRRVVWEFDFGRSWTRPEPVGQALRQRFPATLELTLAAMLVAVGLGLAAGIIAARRPNTMADWASMSAALLGLSIPVFWLGLMLAWIFAVKLQWLPLSHRLPSALDGSFQPITGLHVIDGLLLRRWDVAGAALRHLCLPALTVGTISAALIARMTRASMLEVASQDYVRTARAKGLSNIRVTRHIFRNAIIPIVTVIGLQLGALLGGAIVTETIFSWDGLGKYLVDSILQRDANAAQGAVLVITAAFVGVNALVDAAYVLLDPRISHRSQRSSGG
jgi:peptide/nickel transport system permease protein